MPLLLPLLSTLQLRQCQEQNEEPIEPAVDDQDADTQSLAPLSIGTGVEAEGDTAADALCDGLSENDPQTSTVLEQEVDKALKRFPDPDDIMGTACDAMLAKLLLWDQQENQGRIVERSTTWPATWSICSGCSGTGSLLASLYLYFRADARQPARDPTNMEGKGN